MPAKPPFIDKQLVTQVISVTALGLTTWASGVTDPGLLMAAGTLLGVAGSRAASAADKNQEDHEWWSSLLVNEDVAKGMATAIQSVIAHEGEDTKLPRHDLAAKLAPLAHERWVALSKEGALFIAELQDSAVLTPLAEHMAGQPVYALEVGAWQAFLLSLIEEEDQRTDAVVQSLVGYLADVLHRTLIPSFLNVIAHDLKHKGALYAKITVRFLGKIDQTTERIESKVDTLLARAIPATHHIPIQLPPAASKYFGRSEIIADLMDRLRKQPRTEVWGGPGMGKTALTAKALTGIIGEKGELLATSPFPDGVVFLDLYNLYKGSADTAWQALANAFDDTLPTTMTAKERAHTACAHRWALIILEGAEVLEKNLTDFITVLAPESHLLVLTRDESQTAAARRIKLTDMLHTEDALLLLLHLAPQVDQAILSAVQQRLGGHPLALTWAGSALADATEPPQDFLSDLRAKAFTALTEPGGDPTHTLKWMFDRTLRHLDAPTQTVLAAAARVSEPFGVSLAEAAGGNKDELKRLVQVAFLRSDAEGWRFTHALAAQFARQLPLPEGLLAELGRWAVAELEKADALCVSQGTGPLGIALAHACALLLQDHTGSTLELLVVALMQDGSSGDTLGIRRGRLDFARRALEAVGLWHEQAPAGLAASDDWQRRRSVVLNRLGNLAVAQGDLAGALRSFTESKTIAARLAASDPANAEWQRDLSVSLNNLGNLAVAQGDLAGALRYFTEDKAIAERLAASDPANAEWQRDLSVSLIKLGDLAVAQGDLAGALRSFTEGKTIAARLAKSDPANAAWQRDLSVSLNKLGNLAVAQGDLAGALRYFTEDKAIAERLAASDPANAEWQRDLWVSYSRLADLCEKSKQAAEAKVWWQMAYDTLSGMKQRGLHASPKDLGILERLRAKAGR